MMNLTIIGAAGLLALTTTAMAAPQVERVRGTVDSVSDGMMTIKTADGMTKTIVLAPTPSSAGSSNRASTRSRTASS